MSDAHRRCWPNARVRAASEAKRTQTKPRRLPPIASDPISELEKVALHSAFVGSCNYAFRPVLDSKIAPERCASVGRPTYSSLRAYTVESKFVIALRGRKSFGPGEIYT